ncbi:unnamed protein product [Ixodes pacificus]
MADCVQRGVGGVPAGVPSSTGSSSLNGTRVYPDGVVWDGPLIQRVATLSVIMLFTLAGNATILVVLSRPRVAKRASRVNLFIFNLALGDLAVCLFTQSSEMLFEVFGSWVLGGVACKVIVYLQIVTLASTTFILTSMSYDRYMAICKPLESRSGLRRARCMVAASWAMAFVFATPQLFIFVQVQTGLTASGLPHLECLSVGYTHHWQRQLYFSWLTLYILVVPGLLISAFYLSLLRAVWAASDAIAVTPAKDSGNGATTLRRCTRAEPLLSRARAKTLKLTVCIIASFVLCWIPYFAVHNVRIHSHYCIKVPRAVIVFAETLALLNSAVNPVFYGLFNAHIRRGLRDIIRACRRRSDLGPERESTMRKGGNAFTTSTCALEASSGDCFPGQPLKTMGSIGAGKLITNGDIAVV